MHARPYSAVWSGLFARLALAVLIGIAHACTGPGLEPPASDNGAGAGTGGAQDGGMPPAGGAGAGGSGGFGNPVGGQGGSSNLDAGEAEMDARVDVDDDGGVDPVDDEL